MTTSRALPTKRGYNSSRRVERAAADAAGHLVRRPGAVRRIPGTQPPPLRRSPPWQGFPLTPCTPLSAANRLCCASWWRPRFRVPTSPSPGSNANTSPECRQCHSAREKLAIYAKAITGIQQRLAPVFLALRDAAVTGPDCAALWTADLAASGRQHAPAGRRSPQHRRTP